jgi:predicted aspartyl protease
MARDGCVAQTRLLNAKRDAVRAAVSASTEVSQSSVATVLAYLSSTALQQPAAFRRVLPKSDVFTIPFRNLGKLIRVEASVNGKKGYFILDSGAPFLMLNDAYFPTLGTELRLVNVSGVTGGVTGVRSATVDSFEWGGMKHASLRCHIVDLRHLEQRPTDSIFGLIGFEIFRDLEMLMDYDASTIVLYKLNAAGERIEYDADYQTPEYVVPFSYKGHLPVVGASIAGVALRFGIDTGAEWNLLSNALDSTVLQSFVRDRKMKLRGSGKATLDTWLGRIEDMRLGNALYISQAALLADIRETNETFSTTLDGLLGQPFLRYRRTVMNFKKKELHLWDFSY